MKRFVTVAAAGAAALGALHLAREMLLRSKRRSFPMEGAVVAIAGGTRGLGLAIARECARRGAKVAICARDPGHLERACDDLASNGYDAFGLDADVHDRNDVDRFVAAVEQRWGAIDAYVHCAGTIVVGPFDAMTEADYREAMDTHFWGAYYGVEAVLPQMRRRSRGQIVLISSIGGIISVPHLLPYCASKFALTGYGLGLAEETSRDNVGVTVVCPGLMRTGSARNAFFKGQNDKEYAWFSALANSPLMSISAERAAHRIVDALQAREHLVVLSPQASLGALVQGVAPNAVVCASAMVSRALPANGGTQSERATGAQSATALTQSVPLQSFESERTLNQR